MYIYIYFKRLTISTLKIQPNVGRYTSPMDPIGLGLEWLLPAVTVASAVGFAIAQYLWSRLFPP